MDAVPRTVPVTGYGAGQRTFTARL